MERILRGKKLGRREVVYSLSPKNVSSPLDDIPKNLKLRLLPFRNFRGDILLFSSMVDFKAWIDTTIRQFKYNSTHRLKLTRHSIVTVVNSPVYVQNDKLDTFSEPTIFSSQEESGRTQCEITPGTQNAVRVDVSYD